MTSIWNHCVLCFHHPPVIPFKMERNLRSLSNIETSQYTCISLLSYLLIKVLNIRLYWPLSDVAVIAWTL